MGESGGQEQACETGSGAAVAMRNVDDDEQTAGEASGEPAVGVELAPVTGSAGFAEQVEAVERGGMCHAVADGATQAAGNGVVGVQLRKEQDVSASQLLEGESGSGKAQDAQLALTRRQIWQRRGRKAEELVDSLNLCRGQALTQLGEPGIAGIGECGFRCKDRAVRRMCAGKGAAGDVELAMAERGGVGLHGMVLKGIGQKEGLDDGTGQAVDRWAEGQEIAVRREVDKEDRRVLCLGGDDSR